MFWGWFKEREAALSDGDCVKEGWRIDDLYGQSFHGTQGEGRTPRCNLSKKY